MELLHWSSYQLGVEYLHRCLTYVDYTMFLGTHQLTRRLSLVFALPFFIINCLKLRRRQKIGLVGVFSLGLITIVISLSRFIVYTATNYTVDDADGSKSPSLSFPACLCPCYTPNCIEQFHVSRS
jgi:hypothetical protein